MEQRKVVQRLGEGVFVIREDEELVRRVIRAKRLLARVKEEVRPA